jgi:hypothetical protein
MPINVRWNNDDKTVLSFIYEGKWELNDFYQALQNGNALLDEVTHSVALVMDVQGSRMIPNGFMGALSNISKKLHPNSGVLIMVGVNAFARAFIATYRKIYPEKNGDRPIHFAANYGEVQNMVTSNPSKREA